MRSVEIDNIGTPCILRSNDLKHMPVTFFYSRGQQAFHLLWHYELNIVLTIFKC